MTADEVVWVMVRGLELMRLLLEQSYDLSEEKILAEIHEQLGNVQGILGYARKES